MFLLTNGLKYINKTIENGRSHSVLVHQIESNLYERQVIAEKISNFENRLPAIQSELAIQTMKDPYENAELVIYEGEGHGFSAPNAQKAREKLLDFITKE